MLRRYVLSRRIEEADRSHVQLMTGRTANILRAVYMLGNEMGFTNFIASDMLLGSLASGKSIHVDSQLSTLWNMLEMLGKSFTYIVQNDCCHCRSIL